MKVLNYPVTRRHFTATRKAEIVLLGLNSTRGVSKLCRDYEISENNYYNWKKTFLAAGTIVGATAPPASF